MSVEFEDFSIEVKAAMDEAAIAYLHEAGGELQSKAARNSRVDTGQTKGSYDYHVDEGRKECQVGSPLENAIWEEFGTGEYALHGDGRKGGWFYEDAKGEGHFTHGKTPKRPMQEAFDSSKNALIRRAEEVLKDKMEG